MFLNLWIHIEQCFNTMWIPCQAETIVSWDMVRTEIWKADALLEKFQGFIISLSDFVLNTSNYEERRVLKWHLKKSINKGSAFFVDLHKTFCLTFWYTNFLLVYLWIGRHKCLWLIVIYMKSTKSNCTYFFCFFLLTTALCSKHD